MKSGAGMNIVAAENADLNSNYVYSVEKELPLKEQVLNYLYKDGPEPQVKAKVSQTPWVIDRTSLFSTGACTRLTYPRAPVS